MVCIEEITRIHYKPSVDARKGDKCNVNARKGDESNGNVGKCNRNRDVSMQVTNVSVIPEQVIKATVMLE